MGFGFTSWANNNSAPYADYLALRSYSDASGGNDNLLMFNKSTLAMRLWQQSFGSASPYASYVDIITTGSDFQTKSGVFQSDASLRAPIFYDSNNTGYYLDPRSTAFANFLWITNDTTFYLDPKQYCAFLFQATALFHQEQEQQAVVQNRTYTGGRNAHLEFWQC
jgi:hypothetical protein